MSKPTIAVVSFPGNNCEFESLRAIASSGMEPLYFRWNDDRQKLANVDGYFLVGGFSYEDRGRSGMVAGRDALMEHIARDAQEGKVVIGNCNGAQILVESGLIPLDHGLRMSLARNVMQTADGFLSPGFLSQWVWITPTCKRDRCATSDWAGPMHLPIAHGEGRFTTNDRDVIEELRKNDQLAFSYCDETGTVSEDPIVTPNGSMFALAGICNPAGNVIALMPHPERTTHGKPYFDALRKWAEKGRTMFKDIGSSLMGNGVVGDLPVKEPRGIQIFIDTIIVNNEERTVEQTARKFAPLLCLKQWKYLATQEKNPAELLADLSVFNPNKERAFVRREGRLYHWNHSAKREDPMTDEKASALLAGTKLLRRDLPDTGAKNLGRGGETGICYACSNVAEQALDRNLLEVFSNPHASELHILR